MIDTIHFDIFNITDRYSQMVGYLNVRNMNKEYSVLKFRDMQSQKVLTIKKGRIYIPSSSRYINYTWDKLKDKISFEFSIPKAIYGTNIFQFVNHRMDLFTPFCLSESVVIKNQIKKTHRRLIHFIKKFLLNHCLYHVVTEKDYRIKKREDNQYHLISMQDIEISRLDFCFNRIFLSKKNCLDYLELLKAVHKKGQRNAVNKSRFGYDTSIYLVGRYYTLKIYHKGSEFNHIRNGESDKKGLININKAKGYEEYNIDKLQSFADRTLRYEVEYKKPGMNYIYKRNIYKSKDNEYKKIKKLALKYDAIQAKIDRLTEAKKFSSKLNLYLIKLGYNSYNEAMTMLLQDLKKYSHEKEFYEKSQTQSSDFCLDISAQEADCAEYVMDDELDNFHRKCFIFSKNALFSSQLVQYIGLHFLKFINEFTLKTLNESIFNSEMIIKTIEKRNIELKSKGLKGINLSLGFKEFIRLLDIKSIDEIKESKMYERTTLYRYKKQLESIGYVRQSLMEWSIPFGEDFAEYYMYVNTDTFDRNVKCKYF
jgi:hypothetical protein